MSYGKLLPGTALFAPIAWLLHVKLLAQYPPLGSITPHCFSTSTGPFAFGTFGFAASISFFVFFFTGCDLSPRSPSALRFFAPMLLFLVAVLVPIPEPAGLSPSSSPSASSSSSLVPSTPRAPPAERSFASRSRALRFASFCSFFRCARSFLRCRQIFMWEAATARSMGFLQCLHCSVSEVSSIGRPVAKVSASFLSTVLRRGEDGASGSSEERHQSRASVAGISRARDLTFLVFGLR
jgi:hypothetical protein